MPRPPGLYETLVTLALERAETDLHAVRDLGEGEAARRLAGHFGDHLERALASLPSTDRLPRQLALVNELVAVVERHAASFPASDDAVRPRVLEAVLEAAGAPAPTRPQLPLSESGLYVNANRERRLDVALELELDSADRVDLICAFLFWKGYLRLRDPLRRHLVERQRGLRVLTTTYRGVTDARVLDELAAWGADVRVSYEVGGTRLHAKAWLLHRESRFSTAYVGSSNLSASALTSGLEWNVRLSEVENRGVLEELRGAFESYWSDEEFEPYDPEVFARESKAQRPSGDLRAVLSLQPRPFQRAVLERIAAEREVHDRHRNLVVAATGTGKTVIAALDYRRLCAAAGRRLRLLFVAHRREILTKTRDTFRHAMSDGSFGELYVDGMKPDDWTHVFASVQSLHHVDLESLAPDHFDVLVVDEFHHAHTEGKTYARLLRHFQPAELLGLTATPERADGGDILPWFDGRIADELRLWDAIDRGLLVPFHYFAVHDTTDLRSVWRRGRFDPAALEGLYTGHHVRAHLVVEAIREHMHDPLRMRALAFCVGVGHARFMAEVFAQAGIACAVVTGETRAGERAQAVKDLRDGAIACLLTVDVFNEGVDIPEIDTVLFLRPTESATVFLQQLGRGLRRFEGKRCLTVLDFVGRMHDQFRFADRFRALLGKVGRKALHDQVEQGFPVLPAGCAISLDRQSRELILENLRTSLRIDGRSLLRELMGSHAATLAEFLDRAGLELHELYRGGRTFAELRRAAGQPCPEPGPDEAVLAKGLGRILHVDDRERLDAWRAWLGHTRPSDAIDPTLRLMLLTTLWGREAASDVPNAAARLWAHPALREELLAVFDVLEGRLDHVTLPLLHPGGMPLRVHATYRMQEIMAAFGDVRDGGLYLPREGVHFDVRSGCDLLFVTLVKDEEDYSPTTMYADYALDERRFHWQSQSGTRPTDTKGQRHVRHAELGVTPLLFVRLQRKDDRNETVAYQLLGPATLEHHHGERPMSIVWRLDHAMPAAVLRAARVVA